VLKTQEGNIVGKVGTRLMRRHAVEHATGLSRSTLYQYMAEGRFQKPPHLSSRIVVWLESEVLAWIAARLAERDDREGRPVGPCA